MATLEERRKLFQEKAEEKFAIWRAEIEKLFARAKKGGTAIGADLEDGAKAVEQRLWAARKKIEELEKVGEGAYRDAKASLEKGWGDVRKTFAALRRMKRAGPAPRTRPRARARGDRPRADTRRSG